MSDPTALPNFPPPPQERPLVGRVLDALQDLGFGPDLDAEGDVAFEASGQKLFVKVVKGDRLDIMRVFGTWQISETVPADPLTRLNGCNDVTLGVNLVKAGIAGGNLVLSVEQIVGAQEAPKAKLQIATGLILQALQLWHRNVVAKSRVEQGLDPQIPDAAPEGTQVGPWLSVGNAPRPAAEDGPTDATGTEDARATGTGDEDQP